MSPLTFMVLFSLYESFMLFRMPTTAMESNSISWFIMDFNIFVRNGEPLDVLIFECEICENDKQKNIFHICIIYACDSFSQKPNKPSHNFHWNQTILAIIFTWRWEWIPNHHPTTSNPRKVKVPSTLLPCIFNPLPCIFCSSPFTSSIIIRRSSFDH